MFQVLVATGVMISYFINCMRLVAYMLCLSGTNCLRIPRWGKHPRKVRPRDMAYPVWFPARPRWNYVLWPFVRYRVPPLARTEGA